MKPEFLESILTRDEQGELHALDVYQLRGAADEPPRQDVRTAVGERVEELGRGRFRIVATGQVLRALPSRSVP